MRRRQHHFRGMSSEHRTMGTGLRNCRNKGVDPEIEKLLNEKETDP
jgi:hypothetical protein